MKKIFADIRTLCPKCVSEYYDTGEYVLRCIDPSQTVHEPCQLCTNRNGKDYIITRKNKH